MLDLSLDLAGLKPIEVPFTLPWQPDKKYLLCEASEGASSEHQDEMLRITKPDDNGKPTNMAGAVRLDAVFLSRCIFRLDGENRVPLTPEEVLLWNARLIKKLRDKLREISEINQDEKTLDAQIKNLEKQRDLIAKGKSAAKNGQSATMATSV